MASSALRLLLGLACVLSSTLALAPNELRAKHEAQVLQARQNPLDSFKEWVQIHSKAYHSDLEEYKKRFSIWLENLDYIIAHNAKGKSHWLGLTPMADLTTEEYKQFLGYNFASKKAMNKAPSGFKYASVDEGALPVAIDWRAKGAVTNVKNQQQCGSCWAFSTTGSVEGINAIVSGKLASLSEQELVDCDTSQDKGCHGGLMDYAFQFIIDNKGIDTEDDYPYTAEEGQCDKNRLNRRVVTIDGFEDVPENDEASLKKAVAHQPVSVAIEADQKSFQLYMGGVYDDDECGTQLDHGVLVVGYGRDPAQGAYWIVKNSWGPEWGEQGYIRLKAGVKAHEGMCGIAMVASYPVKTSPNPPEPPPAPKPKPGPKPKPKPKPSPTIKCDDSAECPAQTTCCCVDDFLGTCVQWGCCPMPNATCCEDHEHCCPEDLPVCDTDGGRCLPKTGSNVGAASVAWATKIPAITKKQLSQPLKGMTSKTAKTAAQ